MPACPVGNPVSVKRYVPGSPATGVGTGLTTRPEIGWPLNRTVNFCSELRIDVSSLLVSSPLPLRSVKVMSIDVSGLVSSSVASATGLARAAVGASDDAPDGDPLPRPASIPSRSKSLTEKICMWKPLTGSMVNVALPPTLNTGVPLSVIETVAPVMAR